MNSKWGHTGRGVAGLAVVVALGAAGLARAADGDRLWGYDGVEIAPACDACTQAIASDGSGGAIVVWDATAAGIWAQRLTAGGTPLWGASGVQLAWSGQAPALFGDGAGAATVAWHDASGIRVQRISAAGVAQWTFGGVLAGTSGQYPVIVTDGWGGAFIAWDAVGARCAHINGSGVLSSPGVNGIALGGQPVHAPGNRLRAIYDGTGGVSGPGGVIVVWADAYKDIVAQRVAGGLPWGSAPVVVSADPRDERDVEIARAYPSGVLIAWAPYFTYPAERQVRVQRLDLSGVAAWTVGGVIVVDSDDVGGYPDNWAGGEVRAVVARDGGSGAIVAWNDWRYAPTPGNGNDDIRAQRVDDAGIPRWEWGGVRLPTVSEAGEVGSRRRPTIAADLLGGAIVAAQDSGGTSWDITADRVDADGNLHWAKTVYSDYGATDEGPQLDPELVYDGSGSVPLGAVVVWFDDARNSTAVQKIEISSPSFDACASATVIGAGTYESSTVGATQDGSATCGGTKEVWFRYGATGQGTLRVTTCGTNDLGGIDLGIDTVLSLHSGCPGTTANELGCNDDWTSSAATGCSNDLVTPRDSVVEIPVTNGQEVLIRVARFGSSPSGPFVLEVSPRLDGCGRTPQDASWDGTPLTAQRGLGGNIVLQWGVSCLASDDDYAVYEGALGTYYSHSAKACTTGGATWLEIAPRSASAYYLVVPRHGDVEGSYGWNTVGSERARGTPACTTVQRIRRCP